MCVGYSLKVQVGAKVGLQLFVRKIIQLFINNSARINSVFHIRTTGNPLCTDSVNVHHLLPLEKVRRRPFLSVSAAAVPCLGEVETAFRLPSPLAPAASSLPFHPRERAGFPRGEAEGL